MTVSGEDFDREVARKRSRQAGLYCEVLHEANGRTVLAPSGEIDLTVKETFARRLDDVLELDVPRTVVVDLHRVTFMDSSGLNALAQARRRAERSGIRLVVTGAASIVRQALEITGLGELLGHEPGSTAGDAQG
jgi:anti-sigma B factor antagonist